MGRVEVLEWDREAWGHRGGWGWQRSPQGGGQSLSPSRNGPSCPRVGPGWPAPNAPADPPPGATTWLWAVLVLCPPWAGYGWPGGSMGTPMWQTPVSPQEGDAGVP